MQSMEVWGGSHFIAQGVEIAGLDAWVYRKPFRDDSDGGGVSYASSRATGWSRLLFCTKSAVTVCNAGQLKLLINRAAGRFWARRGC